MPRLITGPEPYDMDSATAARVQRMTEEADRDLLGEEVRVNFRWTRGQLELMKRAAALYGVTYQAYLKQAATRQAIADLRDAAAAHLDTEPGRRT